MKLMKVAGLAAISLLAGASTIFGSLAMIATTDWPAGVCFAIAFTGSVTLAVVAAVGMEVQA